MEGEIIEPNVSVPIENPTVHRQVLNEIMAINLKDEMQSWNLSGDGKYTRHIGDNNFSSHEYFLTHISHSGQGDEKDRVAKGKQSGQSGC